MTDTRPIGVFDSGMGGLTVLAALRERLPDESTVYLGDTARVPYGTRSAEAVIRYAKNNARTLLKTDDIKALVIACNTASAVALGPLQETLPVPVIGVIEPGARAALEATRGGTVLVLGTAGTVRSEAYPRALRAEGFQGQVLSRPCPLLVPLVEEGWTEGEVPTRVLERYLDGLPGDLDTAVLGCTHYPLLRGAIEGVLPAGVRVVDGGRATADELAHLLDEKGLTGTHDAPTHRVLVTDAPEQMEALGPRFLGHHLPVDHVELVDVLFEE